MLAICVDPSAPLRLTLKDVPQEAPLPHEVLVQVQAISLNQGEVRNAINDAPAGWNPGWDFAGVVERAATVGPSPPVGSRVVGFREEGAWREHVTVPARALAVLPDNVSTAIASTLPVAGLTALLALAEGGLLVGKKVLINGASGGVGHLAVQLARASGAVTVAAVRRESQRSLAEADGADCVVVTNTLEEARAEGPYDLILESVGGTALGNALSALKSGGTCVSFGNSSRTPARFEPFDFFYPHGNTRLVGFYLLAILARHPPAEGLNRLASATARGILKPRIEVEAPWEQIGAMAERFVRRELTGKVVLRVRGD